MINQMIAELRMIESRTRRQWEADAAERANSREYNISPESKDALERGDRQRRTGVYEHDSNVNLITCAWCFALVPDDEVCNCNNWYFYSKGEFVEDLNRIQRLLGTSLYEVETVSGVFEDKNYIRRVED